MFWNYPDPLYQKSSYVHTSFLYTSFLIFIYFKDRVIDRHFLIRKKQQDLDFRNNVFGLAWTIDGENELMEADR